MIKGILGKKVGMTQVFDQDGDLIPVTVVQAGPCKVVQRKTQEKDGYSAAQLGFEPKKKRVNKPMKGHFEKAGAEPATYLREIRHEGSEELDVGQEVTANIFSEGDLVDVTGTSKGRGFAGVMKRHGFTGLPASHGTHETFRGPGSIGSAADPSRVFKGLRMAGHMGNERVTVQNIKVFRVLQDRNLIMLKGAVPGPNGGLLIIRKSKKKAADAAKRAEKR